ncbi:MAG: hypothetical protein JO358_06560, partial [Alphaproteobacteria bacterium]|nr:hypothetical protein [Alphaproteobacteria bacterium]
FYLLLSMGFLYVLATNRFAVVGLGKAHAAQSDVTVSGLAGYLLVGFIGSFGGLLIAMAIMFRRYYLILFALAGFVCCYGTLSERSAVLMPAWIAYIYATHRLFFRDSTTRYLLAVMAPFALCVLLAFILGLEVRHSFVYDAFTLANHRLYSIPAISFNVYYHFFATHPLTFWSHIGFVSNFVPYPYGEPLSLVMAEAYELGNANASFLETDGLAAAGPMMLPFVSLIFGLVMVAINSCARGLNLTLCATAVASLSVAAMDTGIGPTLLTNGAALLALILLFVPRNASWNLYHLNRLQRHPVGASVS